MGAASATVIRRENERMRVMPTTPAEGAAPAFIIMPPVWMLRRYEVYLSEDCASSVLYGLSTRYLGNYPT